MTVPIPGSHHDEPDDDPSGALRREIVRLHRALHSLQRYEGNGAPHPRGPFVYWTDMTDTLRGDA